MVQTHSRRETSSKRETQRKHSQQRTRPINYLQTHTQAQAGRRTPKLGGAKSIALKSLSTSCEHLTATIQRSVVRRREEGGGISGSGAHQVYV